MSIRIKQLCFIYILLAGGIIDLFGQETPPFRYYGAQEYQAAAQNWKMTNNPEGEVFFANNEGVVHYDGAHWQTLKSVNQSIVRSVHFADNRLYVGMYMEFGYYQKDEYGVWQYTSLAENIRNQLIEDEQFWNILPLGNQLVFQSLDQLIVYDPQKSAFAALAHSQGITGAWAPGNSLYVQDTDRDLYRVEGGQWIMIADAKALGDALVVGMKSQQGVLTAVNEWGVFWTYQSGTWTQTLDAGLRAAHVYSAAVLADGGWALGTISDGISIWDAQGRKQYQLGSSNGIKNNTVLSIHQDDQAHIWLGLDNGIICINNRAPLRSYVDQQSEWGTIYASAHWKDITYLGTNVGLFYRDASMRHYSQVTGSSGQVWSLSVQQGTLVMGHHLGAFAVEGTKLTPLSSGTGAWTFTRIPETNKMIIGTYKGLELVEWRDNRWNWLRKMEGFNLSARYVAEVNQKTFLVSHEYKGIYRLTLSDDLSSVSGVEQIDQPEKGAHSALARFEDAVWYHAPSGLWKYATDEKKFIHQGWADQLLGDDPYYSGKMISFGRESLWFFKQNKVVRITPALTRGTYTAKSFPVALETLKPMRGFENLGQLKEDQYLIGGVNQYLVLDNQAPAAKTPAPLIQHIEGIDQKNATIFAVPVSGGPIPYRFNTVQITVGAPAFNVYKKTQYQYRLLGHQELWSEWSDQAVITWPRLSPGSYQFEVRSGSSAEEPSEVRSYSFEVATPWFMHPLMWLFYLVFSLGMIWTTHRSYLRYFSRQKLRIMEENERNNELNQLQVKQQFIQDKNQFLEDQFSQKKKELANTLLHLNKNIELLIEVKDQLGRSSQGDSFKELIRRIHENLTDEDSWQLLEEAFNNVDQEFLSKLKTEFTELSPSELKLCVYLRLNLSTKEIATLLNITPKSVEIKRYRLRKKLNLGSEDHLQDFILGY